MFSDDIARLIIHKDIRCAEHSVPSFTTKSNKKVFPALIIEYM
jgi:hypothetical protein